MFVKTNLLEEIMRNFKCFVAVVLLSALAGTFSAMSEDMESAGKAAGRAYFEKETGELRPLFDKLLEDIQNPILGETYKTLESPGFHVNAKDAEAWKGGKELTERRAKTYVKFYEKNCIKNGVDIIGEGHALFKEMVELHDKLCESKIYREILTKDGNGRRNIWEDNAEYTEMLSSFYQECKKKLK